MDIKVINQELARLREEINGRKSLLREYTMSTNQLATLPKGKENYDAILALTEQQENLLAKLKENKILGETYLQKIEEKAELLKRERPTVATEITNMETVIVEQEAICIQVSESVTVATELLNELGKLNRQGGKAKGWGIGDLLGGLFSKQKKYAHLKEAKTIIGNIRKLTKRYKKELENIKITTLPDLPIGGFLGTVDHFINNPVTEIMVQLEIRKLLKKTKAFEAHLMQQLERVEEKESELEAKIKNLKQQKIEWIEKA